MINAGLNLAEQLSNALSHFDHYAPTSFEKAIKRDIESNCHWPYNVVEEEDGSITYEVAVVGKGKGDVEVTTKASDPLPMLIIEVQDKPADNKRKYIEERIKKGQLRLEISVETKYDLNSLEAKLENGLLSVTVPLSKVAEPEVKKFEIK